MATTEDSPASSIRGTANRNEPPSANGEPPAPGHEVNLDVSWLVSTDLLAIDVLARMHVIACRDGRSLWLHGATTELIDLLELVGLRGVVHLCPCASRHRVPCFGPPWC
jgi:hypothetical protein